jgi:hypothetical protein
MDSKIAEIKAQLNRGRMTIPNIEWLVAQYEELNKEIRGLKEKNRFKGYMEMAEENLKLEESLKLAREQRDHYKQAYEAIKKAI